MTTLATIIARECRTRLRRPSYWVLTLLVPIALSALYALPVATAHRATQSATVLVVDQTGLFQNNLHNTPEATFQPATDIDRARQQMQTDRHIDAVLFIPSRETTIPHDAYLYHRGSAPSPTLRSLVDHQLQTTLRNAILEDVYQLPPSAYHTIENTRIRLRTQEAATGHESHGNVKTAVAIILALLVVLSIIIYGVQAMKSAQEERQSKIIEVIATTVNPRTLLIGKLLGIILTAALQMTLWAMLTLAAIHLIQTANPQLFDLAYSQQHPLHLATKGAEATAQYTQPTPTADPTISGLAAINLPLTAAIFALSFLLGYLLYATLMTALAARLDSDADALQWALLLASPMLLALLLTPLVMQSPSGTLAQWLTLIPLTAPVAILQRLPFGLPTTQLLLATLLTLATTLATTTLAAHTYRRNILNH